MKTKQPRIINLRFGKPPIQTSYIVTDYHNGYNTGEYYFKKYQVDLLPHIIKEAFYTVTVDVGGLYVTAENKKSLTMESKESIVDALKYMHNMFHENPNFLPLRIYH